MDKPSAERSFEATLANKSTSELFNLGIEFILKAENLFIKFHTSDWNLMNKFSAFNIKIGRAHV